MQKKVAVSCGARLFPKHSSTGPVTVGPKLTSLGGGFQPRGSLGVAFGCYRDTNVKIGAVEFLQPPFFIYFSVSISCCVSQ